MKKTLFTIFAAMAVLASCEKTPLAEENGEKPGKDPVEEGVGKLSLELTGNDGGFNDIHLKSSSVDVNTFKVKIEGLNGAYSEEWENYSEMPSVLELSSGDYTITATSPKTSDSKWGEPEFSGAESFRIEKGATSTVNVECAISNVKVSVNLSDEFKNEIIRFEITVMEDTDGGKSLTWTNEDVGKDLSGYFSAVPLRIYVKGYRWDSTDENPVTATFTKKITDVSAADHYVLNLSAITTGKGSLGISVDDSLSDEEVDILLPGLDESPVQGGDVPEFPDIPDEPDTDPITMEWPANPSFSPMEITQGMDVVINISAPAGIRTFNVSIQSDVLNEILTELDLVNPGNLSAIAEMILNGQVLLNATSLRLDLSSLVPMILELGPDPDTDHVFVLNMSDNDGNRFSKRVVFHYSGN